MNREQLLNQLSDLILSCKLELPLRVGIDGVDCSGKTTLANDLRQKIESRGLPAINASIDSFSLPRSRRYEKGPLSPNGYYNDSFDYDSVRKNLLEPLSSPPFPTLCSLGCFDVRKDAPIPMAVTCVVTTDTVLLMEGVFLFRPELNQFWDYRVFVDVSFETSLARALHRDLSLLGDVDNIRKKYEQRYIPAQRLYLDEVNPKSLADVIVHNNNPQDPEITLPSASFCDTVRT